MAMDVVHVLSTIVNLRYTLYINFTGEHAGNSLKKAYRCFVGIAIFALHLYNSIDYKN